MFSHMGLTASRSPGKEKPVIFNGAGQNGAGQAEARQNEVRNRRGQGQRPKELGQLQKESTQRGKELSQNYKKSGQTQGQNYKDLGQQPGPNRTGPGLGRPFIVSGATRTDNEAATKPHPKEQRPQKVKLTQAKKVIASGMTEAEAIDRAKAGDAEAFSGLYGLHKRRVYSLCLRMTGNTAEAEDLTQEAFLQLYRKIATFRGESAFSTWLHRLAVNVVLMHLRKKGLPEVSLDEALEPQHEDGPKKDIGARDNVLAGSIDRVNLERAIESLPPGYRIIFVLHDVEGYEHNEIAEMMGCSIGNSKSQLHKARMKLRDLLKLSRAEKAARR
jgi:RNA polymerase sigma-70 factor, ECF subfamily